MNTILLRILVLAAVSGLIASCDKPKEAGARGQSSCGKAPASCCGAAKAAGPRCGAAKPACADCAAAKATPAPGAEEAADLAPDFALTDQDGNKVRLADHRGKIVVLEWTNPDCPFVKRHYAAGTMKRLAEKYAPKGVMWLAINTTNYWTVAKNKGWHTMQNLPYPVLDDRAGTVGKLYGARTTPHMFIVHKDGRLVYQGAVDDDPTGKGAKVNYVEQTLDELLAGKPVTQAEMRPYGCSVKYAQ